MVATLVSLKIRLTVNILRQQPQRMIGFVIYLVLTIGGGIAGGVTIARSSWDAGQTESAVVAIAGAVWLAWAILPVAMTGVDTTLDPTRLSDFPLRAHQAIPGLLLASLLNGAPIGTFAILLGLAWRAGSPIGIAVGAVAALGHVLLCIVTSRALTTGLSAMMRNRRTRDLSFTIMAFLAALGGLSGQFARPIIGWFDWDRTAAIADVLRWIPTAIAGRAIAATARGDVLAGIALCVGLLVLLSIAGWLWWRFLDRALTTEYASADRTETAEVGDLTPKPLRRLLGTGAVGTITSRELRYLWRHPRARADVVTSFIFAGVMFAPMGSVLTSGDPRMVLLAGAAGGVLGLSALNMLAVDGSAAWIDALMVGFRDILRAKALARMIVAAAPVMIVGVVLAAISGGWIFLPLVPFFAGGLFAVNLGMGVCATVLSPVGLPAGADTNPWNARSGVDFGRGMLSFAFFFGGMIVGAPIVGLGLLATTSDSVALPLVALFAVLYGMLIWMIGLDIAVRYSERRGPEVLELIRG